MYEHETLSMSLEASTPCFGQGRGSPPSQLESAKTMLTEDYCSVQGPCALPLP